MEATTAPIPTKGRAMAVEVRNEITKQFVPKVRMYLYQQITWITFEYLNSFTL